MSLYPAEVMRLHPSVYWRLGETSGTSAVDRTRNGNTGTYTGSPTLGATGLLTGDPDKAVTLDGSSQYITVPDDSDLEPGDTGSWGMWLKRSALGTAQTLMHKGTNSAALQLTTGNLFQFTKTGVAAIVASTVTVADTTTAHLLVATKSAATVKLYLDGADVTGTVTNQTIIATADALEIGRFTGSQYTAGTIDEVMIFPYALTAAQILRLYNIGVRKLHPATTNTLTLTPA